MVDHIKIIVTQDYDSLVPFFISHGLEFDAEEEVPTDILKSWRAEDETGRLVGGAVLAKREGEYICDGIATATELRSAGLGRRLLDTLITEIKERGGHTLFLVARAPGFFAKNGFEVVKREDAPNFFECFSCSQYQKTCFPEVMLLNF